MYNSVYYYGTYVCVVGTIFRVLYYIIIVITYSSFILFSSKPQISLFIYYTIIQKRKLNNKTY